MSPLHQGAIANVMVGEPTGESDRFTLGVASENAACRRRLPAGGQHAQHGIERAEGHATDGAEAEPIEQLTA